MGAVLQLATLMHTTSTLSFANKWDYFAARIGYKRSRHLVEPGLYSIGKPDTNSPVFVTANYTLSFDALRSSLDGIDGYILVLDTFGVNVWCAAGKGTFGTDELAKRIEITNLKDVVSHRRLILPQLGAPGVSAHEVERRTGFSIEYGPVRAKDIPEYMKTRIATEDMRRVTFNLGERSVLVLVEATHWLIPAVLVCFLLNLFVGPMIPLALFMVIFAGVILFPIFLPWIPTRDFTSKGLILGILVSLPFALSEYDSRAGSSIWLPLSYSAAYVLLMSPGVAYLSLGFTGSSTFTSRTGVRREIFTYIPILAAMFLTGFALAVAMLVGEELELIT